MFTFLVQFAKIAENDEEAGDQFQRTFYVNGSEKQGILVEIKKGTYL
jgi:hypothetical protein